ncbi:MAG: chemotaxis protein CheD [Thermogutta sp.]
MVITASISSPGVKAISVGMGQTAVGDKESVFTSVLGSCVGVILWHPRLGMGAMAHVVLPASHGQNSQPGKFADTAIPHLLSQLAEIGCPRAGLVAKIAGGACMFKGGGPLQIGDENIAAVRTILRQAGIPLAGEDTGGTSGRKVTFECATGRLTVEIAGQKPRLL